MCHEASLKNGSQIKQTFLMIYTQSCERVYVNYAI